MALVRIPTLDSRGNSDEGIVPTTAFVDTVTGKVMNQVMVGDSENGYQPVMKDTGKTWEFANRAGADGKQIYGSSGYVAPTFRETDGGYDSMAAGGLTPKGDYQLGDPTTNPKLVPYLQSKGVPITYDPQYGYVVEAKYKPDKVMADYRNTIYTGTTTPGSFWDGVGPVALTLAAFGGAAALGGAGAAGAGSGEAGLSGIYNAGAGGFGAPVSAYESALPLSAGMDAAAAGNLGTLAGTGGLTPLADAAVAGTGFNSSVGYGANAVGDGVTSSISMLDNSVNPMVAGTSETAPTSFSNGFNPSDPSTWPNISTPDGTGLSDLSTPQGLDNPLSQYTNPLPNTGGLPQTGSVVNLSNSTQMMPGTGSTAGVSSLSGLNNASSAKSALDRILNGDGTAADYAKLLGTGVDLVGANAARLRSDQLWNAGSDSRARFNAGMTPGFDLNNIPGYKSALDTSAQAYLSKLSAAGGNPTGTGSSQAETQKYLMGSVGLPFWNSYEGLNANTGFGTGVENAGTTGISNLASAAGQGIGSLTGTNDLTSTLGNLSSLNASLKKLGINASDIFTTAT